MNPSKFVVYGCGAVVAVLSGMTAARFASAEGERRGPPPEAIDACKDRSEGEECTVEFRGTELTGTCRRGPDGDGDLICLPEGAGPRRAPPPEAFEACDGAEDGDACLVELPRHTLAGVCRMNAEEERLVCMPQKQER